MARRADRRAGPLGPADHAALGGGWAIGPLTSGLLGQWAPAPTVLPYLVHVALTLISLALLPAVPETLGAADHRAGPDHLGVPTSARSAFGLVVLPDQRIEIFTFPGSRGDGLLPLLLAQAMPRIAVADHGLVAGVALLTGVVAPSRTRPAVFRARTGPLWLASSASRAQR